MALDLVNYETKAVEAVQAFWGNREKALKKQIEIGRIDAGERGSVTEGKNMDGLIVDIIKANGLVHAHIHKKRRVVTLPGHFRPVKIWDLLVTNEGRLIAALELKSRVSPSVVHSFNNQPEAGSDRNST